MGENKNFLEIVDVKKAYGEGDTRQETKYTKHTNTWNGMEISFVYFVYFVVSS